MEWVRQAFEKELLGRNLLTTLLVGTILTVINQWEGLKEPMEQLSWGKLLLTFLVPFLVSSYSAVRAKMRFEVGTRAPYSSDLACAECGKEETHVHEGDLIPECSICRIDTNWKPH